VIYSPSQTWEPLCINTCMCPVAWSTNVLFPNSKRTSEVDCACIEGIWCLLISKWNILISGVPVHCSVNSCTTICNATSRRVLGSIPSHGIFSGASDSSMCPGVDSASKNEYQVIPGGKDGRCLRVTTLPPPCAECQKFWSLNLPETPKATRPVVGLLHLFYNL